MLIYKITNLTNGKIYIGQTTSSLDNRWKEHCRKSKTGIGLAIKKYGKENFSIKLIARADNIEELNHRETYYIKLFNSLAPNGYNLKSGGSHGKHSEVTKKRLSQISKNQKRNGHSEETKRKIAHSHIGKKTSQETRNKLSVSLKGKLAWNKGLRLAKGVVNL